MSFIKLKIMSKHEKIPRRKRKTFYTNSYSKIRVKEDLIADKLQVSYWGSCLGRSRGIFWAKFPGSCLVFCMLIKKLVLHNISKKQFFKTKDLESSEVILAIKFLHGRVL